MLVEIAGLPSRGLRRPAHAADPHPTHADACARDGTWGCLLLGEKGRWILSGLAFSSVPRYHMTVITVVGAEFRPLGL